MAKSPRGKGTKAAAVKRKPAPKVVKRTIIAETMTPQPETRESLMDMGPITLEGTFDDGAISALERAWQDANGAPRELTISPTRRFLWWNVAREHGAPVAILSPWWERTLYAIARIWS